MPAIQIGFQRILNWEFYLFNTFLKDHYSRLLNIVYLCLLWKKNLCKDLSLKFVIPLYTYAVSHAYICFIFSLIISHPWRKTGSWVMSNDFVIKCCSFVRIEWLSTLVNGSMPRDRYNHSWLTFCLRPAASSYYSSCQMLPKDSSFLFFPPLFFYVHPYEHFSPSGAKRSVKDSRNKPSATKEDITLNIIDWEF